MQNSGAACPGGRPLVGVAVDAVYVGDGEERGDRRLLGGLAGEKARGGGSQNKADREVRMRGESVENEGYLDGGDAAAGGEEKVFFMVGGVRGSAERRCGLWR